MSSWEPYPTAAQFYFPSAMAHSTFAGVPSTFNTPENSPLYPPSHSYDPSSGSDDSENRKGKGGPIRRYKTPSPQLLRTRRNAANERERRRMLTLNHAYDKLRTVLPEMDSGRRLSKFETLQMAQQYIECLAEILKNPPKGS